MMSRIIRLLGWVNLAIDLVWLNVALFVSSWVFVSHDLRVLHKSFPHILIINFLWLFIQSYFHIYERYVHRNSVALFKSLFRAVFFFSFSLLFVYALALQNTGAAVGANTGAIEDFRVLPIAYVCFVLLVSSTRLALLTVRKYGRHKEHHKKNVVIVGNTASTVALTGLLTNNEYSQYNVLGIFHNDNGSSTFNAQNLYMGTVSACADYLQNNRVDEVYCTISGLSKENLDTLMYAADRNLTRFRLVTDYYEYLPGRIHIEMFENIPVVTSRREPLEDLHNAVIKRLFDLVFSLAVCLLLLSWLLPVLAIVIRLDSPGPIFFRQLRSGRNNQPFYCLKLRSMAINKDSDTVQASKGDKRITKVGAFLRRTSLDELPQFFNVLSGNMSVVGPRPHMLKHTEEYATLIDRFMVRHFLKPGITGWAQVTGLRGETKTTEDMARRVEADVYYLENWSLLFDLKILFLTVWNIAKGDEKAY
ncbi:MAG: undecaprenyl-phosphate glucose phosphotransferase [Edaphocola sp.]